MPADVWGLNHGVDAFGGMQVIECNVDFKVNPQAVAALRNLLRDSKHPNPILAVVWRGSGPADDVIWRWDIMTHDERALDLIQYLRFKSGDFTFFATHEDLDYLKAELNNLAVDLVDGVLTIVEGGSTV